MAIKLRRVSVMPDSRVVEAMARYKEDIAGFVVEQAVQFADL